MKDLELLARDDEVRDLLLLEESCDFIDQYAQRVILNFVDLSLRQVPNRRRNIVVRVGTFETSALSAEDVNWPYGIDGSHYSIIIEFEYLNL